MDEDGVSLAGNEDTACWKGAASSTPPAAPEIAMDEDGVSSAGDYVLVAGYFIWRRMEFFLRKGLLHLPCLLRLRL
jgi:hypothetical protein